MVNDICYENNQGKKLDLLHFPYRIQTGDLFDYEWEYTTSTTARNGKLTKFTRGISTKEIVLGIMGNTKEEYHRNINTFYEVVDSDVLNMTPGRLWFGSYYLPCYILKSKKEEWESDIEVMDNTITIVTDHPFWCQEKKYTYRKYDGTPEQYEYLDYPYDYPYDLAPRSAAEYLLNEHYAASNFKLVIYGPAESPRIEINRHLYEISTTLTDYEYIVLDSRNRTIYQVNRLGGIKNIYNSRNKENDVFQKIPAGRNLVNWNRKFGFDVTLYEERSEPKWT